MLVPKQCYCNMYVCIATEEVNCSKNVSGCLGMYTCIYVAISFKPGARRPARAWFEITLMRTSVCVCVCVSAPQAIRN